MNLTISGHHLEVTPAIREHIQSKLERIMRHFDQVIDIAVTITVDKLKEKKNDTKRTLIYMCPAKTFTLKALRRTFMLPSIC